MAITDTTVIDQITITENGVILIRRIRRIMDGTDVIGERYSRETLQPGQDITGFPAKIRSICNLIWTPQVIADYKAYLVSVGAA